MKHVITSLAFVSALAITSMALAGGNKGRWFDKLDANKDGKITLDEARAAKDALFTKLDANNDGAISRAEWDARKGGEGKRGKFKGRMFEKMDKDGDGKITRAEARAAAEAMFQRLDQNGDGVVTQEEFKAHKGKHRKGGDKA